MFYLQDDTLYDDIPEAPEITGTLPGLDLTQLDGLFSFISWSAIGEFLSGLWNVYTVLAYILSIILLALYVYATMRWNQYLALQSQQLRDEEKLYDEYYRGGKKNSRLDDVLTHAASENPNDWKLAIIEADIILDEALKDGGYIGDSLGERLRSITPSQLQSVDDAWEAHKVRNKIAHEGSDFILTKRLADETMTRYRRVFADFGIT